MKNHLFYHPVKLDYKKQNVENKIKIIVNQFKKLNQTFWETAKNLVPSEWQKGHEQIQKIETRTFLIDENKEKFIRQINKLFQ